MDNNLSVTVSEFSKEIFKRYPKYFIIINLSLTIAALLEISSLAAVVPLLNKLLSSEAETSSFLNGILIFFNLTESKISIILITIFFLTAFAELFLLLNDYIVAKVAAKIQKKFMNQLMEKVQNAKWEFHLNEKIGELTNAIFSECQRISTGFIYLGKTYSNLIITFIFGTVAFFVSWYGFLIIIILGALSYLILSQIFLL